MPARNGDVQVFSCFCLERKLQICNRNFPLLFGYLTMRQYIFKAELRQVAIRMAGIGTSNLVVLFEQFIVNHIFLYRSRHGRLETRATTWVPILRHFVVTPTPRNSAIPGWILEHSGLYYCFQRYFSIGVTLESLLFRPVFTGTKSWSRRQGL